MLGLKLALGFIQSKWWNFDCTIKSIDDYNVGGNLVTLG